VAGQVAQCKANDAGMPQHTWLAAKRAKTAAVFLMFDVFM